MTRAPQPSPAHLTQEEILAVLGALSRLDWKRIERAADRLALKLSNWTGPILWSEAIWSALDGGRKWPRTVAAIPFIVMAMRGIIWNERKRKRRLEFLDPEAAVADAAPSIVDILEQEERERALRQSVSQAFAFQPNALGVALGRLEGLRGEALRTFTGLDEVSFSSACRALSRELLRLQKRQR